MNIKKRIDDVIHFLVHNSIFFTVVIMCMVHAALFLIMLCAGVSQLAAINVVSVIVYIFCIILCRTGHILPVYYSILLEVSTYAVASVYYIGWHCGSFIFIFSIVPIIIYFGMFLFNRYRIHAIFISLMLDYSVFTVLYIVFHERPPLIETQKWTQMTLTLFSAFVMFVSIIFYSIFYIYSSEKEVDDLAHENEQLSAEACNDTLTGLLNRRGFLPKVEELMKEGDNGHFCIAFLDIDNFKRVNDSYGHECGDEVLKHISKMIKKEMHGCGICRWGGEEIVILMKDYDMAVARQKMEYMRESIGATPTVFYNKLIPVTITVGLEEYRDIYGKPDDIIKTADERMYYGKQHGKNIVISKDMNEADA